MSNEVQVTLENPTSSYSGAYQVIKAKDGAGNILEISLRRTIRVPDNANSYNLPPDCGAFPLYSVSEHGEKLSEKLQSKGGVFVGMYQREAMWINFTAVRPFAVKVYVGGINAVSGESKKKILGVSSDKLKPKQDYVVPPKQKWLDGIAREAGRVSQFVAAPMGSGYSIETQVSGEDSVGGLQIEIIPAMPGTAEHDLPIMVCTLTGKTLSFKVSSHSLVEDLKEIIHVSEGIPVMDQRLIYDGKPMLNGYTLRDYNLQKNDVVHLVLKLRGGGSFSPNEAARWKAEQDAREAANRKYAEELTLAAGGTINQKIVEDIFEPESWDVAGSVMFNISLINASWFPSLGFPKPLTPISATTYAKYGHPFYKMYEEPSDISNSFAIKTVGELDKINGINKNLHTSEGELIFQESKIIDMTRELPSTCAVKLNRVDPISTFLPYRMKEKIKKEEKTKIETLV